MENARVCETVSDAQAQRAGRHRDREDAIAPCVGAITDRTHIFLRVRVTRKPLGSFETSRRRSKKPRASTRGALVGVELSPKRLNPPTPVEHPKTFGADATEL